MGQRVTFYREKAAGMYTTNMYGLAYMLAEIPYLIPNVLLFVIISFFGSDVGDSFERFFEHALPFWLFVVMCTFLSHTVTAISPNYDIANALGPGIATWFSSLAGFYLPKPDIPAAYIWLYWINPFRYTYESMIITMFDGKTFTCNPDHKVPCTSSVNYTEVLNFMGMAEGQSIEWWYWFDQMVVAVYVLVWIIAAFICLRLFTFGSK